ncbi:hypothetical protein CRG98_048893, partial [Punica granatum]
ILIWLKKFPPWAVVHVVDFILVIRFQTAILRVIAEVAMALLEHLKHPQ